VIGIVDYGLGNVRAFENIYRRLGIAVIPARTADDLTRCERLVLPGVGAFDWAMERLGASGMMEVLNRRVLQDHVPILGVCVGMQIMSDGSEEGRAKGLGWIPGRVRRFQDSWFHQTTHLPHMGWNDVAPKAEEPLFLGIEAPLYYFLHSYYFDPAEDSQVIASTDYGIRFASAVRNCNIWATQFHPEKSHHWGISLLGNFARV